MSYVSQCRWSYGLLAPHVREDAQLAEERQGLGVDERADALVSPHRQQRVTMRHLLDYRTEGGTALDSSRGRTVHDSGKSTPPHRDYTGEGGCGQGGRRSTGSGLRLSTRSRQQRDPTDTDMAWVVRRGKVDTHSQFLALTMLT